jgi:F-type H+-transporting ATPase subunit delta
VRDVVEGLVETEHSGARAVLAHFLRLLRLDAARRSVRVDTAAPLDAGDRAAVEATLADRYGAAIDTTFGVDPRLIGGMRLTVGSDVYDGSIRARLVALEARF